MFDKLSRFVQKKDSPVNFQNEKLDIENIPAHVAIIMDGNGRWARKRGLPRVAGHHAGMKTIKEITNISSEIGIQALTLYAFSTENWKRPLEEVEFLMKLPQEYLAKELKSLVKQNIRIQMLGTEENLPSYTIQPIREAIEETANNTGLILNFALNYGSRDELIQAIQHISKDVKHGKVESDEIDAKLVSSYLGTRNLPDPDLLIRTSGELRLSNFMLWQLAYSELLFSEVYWPDFSQRHFLEAIKEYQRRNRRYGALK